VPLKNYQKVIGKWKRNPSIRIVGKSYKTRRVIVVKEQYIQPNPCYSIMGENGCGFINEGLKQGVFNS